MQPTITTRFAPSPTGPLHLGHAHAALVAWRRARDAGGRFLLRLEDIDAARCRPAYAAAILEDLAWLGLDWESVRIQSEHLDDHRVCLDRLGQLGLTYPCFCTRADIALAAPHGGEPVYPGTCRSLSAADAAERVGSGVPYAVRLDTTAAMRRTGTLRFHEQALGWVEARPERLGDVVLARRDTPASYHLCATHDDAAQGVTLVTRGEDLRAATSIHVLLQAVMGWPTPGYAHHRLLTDAAGRRLAKRDRAATLARMREAGMTPAAVRAVAGFP